MNSFSKKGRRELVFEKKSVGGRLSFLFIEQKLSALNSKRVLYKASMSVYVLFDSDWLHIY